MWEKILKISWKQWRKMRKDRFLVGASCPRCSCASEQWSLCCCFARSLRGARSAVFCCRVTLWVATGLKRLSSTTCVNCKWDISFHVMTKKDKTKTTTTTTKQPPPFAWGNWNLSLKQTPTLFRNFGFPCKRRTLHATPARAMLVDFFFSAWGAKILIFERKRERERDRKGERERERERENRKPTLPRVLSLPSFREKLHKISQCSKKKFCIRANRSKNTRKKKCGEDSK